MNFKKWKDIWIKERDEAIRTLDVETFKKFYKKWTERGFYRNGLPSDEVIEISLRKMLYHLGNATEQEKSEAEKWLTERGYDTNMW